MAPKGKSGNRGDDLRQDEILQAVVIADSFNVRFGPITQEKPRALLPLVNVPMLDYTLDFLASAGMQEVFVFCCHLGEQIRTHIRNSRWGENNSSMVVKPVMSEGCISVGDALREIDAKSLVRNDFFLVSGDVIANLNLQAIMDEHKKRREKVKSTVMTLLYKKAPPGHRIRCAEDNVLLAVDTESKRVLHYQRIGLDKNLRIPTEVFEENADLVIHQDLLDCQLCVCTPTVPQLFTDNFDYQTIDDFVRGILINEEIMGNTIHMSVVGDQYCARVSNPYMYDSVSRDVIQRWVCPLTADSVIGKRTDFISLRRHNVYLSKDVQLARECVLEENVVIASGSSVQSKTEIANSVIGKNCKIGENVKMHGCYLWDNVIVEDNCVLNDSILCDGVIVYKNTTVSPRSILSWNVKVGPDINLPVDVRLQASPQVSDFDNNETKQDIPDVTPEFGMKSHAFVFRMESDSDDEGGQTECEWGDPLVSKYDDGEDEAEDADVASLSNSDLSENMSPLDTSIPDDISMFYGEVIDTLRRAREENIGMENVILEINSLKHAYNIAINEVHAVIVKSLVDLPLRESVDKQGPAALKVVTQQLDKYLPLIKNYIKSSEAQLDCLCSLEEFAIENENVGKLLMNILHHLYDRDVLDEAVILKWHKKLPETADVDHKCIHKQLKAFITWLLEAEEESSEDND